MANGNIIKETREALDGGTLTTKAAAILILTILLQHTEDEKAIWASIVPQVVKNQDDIKELKRSNIVMWVNNHPRLFLGIALSFITITSYVNIRTIIMTLLGVIK